METKTELKQKLTEMSQSLVELEEALVKSKQEAETLQGHLETAKQITVEQQGKMSEIEQEKQQEIERLTKLVKAKEFDIANLRRELDEAIGNVNNLMSAEDTLTYSFNKAQQEIERLRTENARLQRPEKPQTDTRALELEVVISHMESALSQVKNQNTILVEQVKFLAETRTETETLKEQLVSAKKFNQQLIEQLSEKPVERIVEKLVVAPSSEDDKATIDQLKEHNKILVSKLAELSNSQVSDNFEAKKDEIIAQLKSDNTALIAQLDEMKKKLLDEGLIKVDYLKKANEGLMGQLTDLQLENRELRNRVDAMVGLSDAGLQARLTEREEEIERLQHTLEETKVNNQTLIIAHTESRDRVIELENQVTKLKAQLPPPPSPVSSFEIPEDEVGLTEEERAIHQQIKEVVG